MSGSNGFLPLADSDDLIETPPETERLSEESLVNRDEDEEEDEDEAAESLGEGGCWTPGETYRNAVLELLLGKAGPEEPEEAEKAEGPGLLDRELG